jgi:hypothetical protein
VPPCSSEQIFASSVEPVELISETSGVSMSTTGVRRSVEYAGYARPVTRPDAYGRSGPDSGNEHDRP